jgi:3-(3-hydroxy-phenyl)propionate hydroxylase
LVNTGRMSVANPYPVSPGVTNGGHSVQNVPITLQDGSRSNLVALARSLGTVFIGILYAPTRADEVAAYACSRPPATVPLRLRPRRHQSEGKLKQVLGAAPGGRAHPSDMYLAGCVPDARPAHADAMLKRALCQLPTAT